jgi:hypothetical protein
MPETRQVPSCSPARAAATTSAQVSIGAPPRDSPVSTLSWTRAGRPAVATAASISASSATE